MRPKNETPGLSLKPEERRGSQVSISKRGDRYLRTLMIQIRRPSGPESNWRAKTGSAKPLARQDAPAATSNVAGGEARPWRSSTRMREIVWAVLSGGMDYEPAPVSDSSLNEAVAEVIGEGRSHLSRLQQMAGEWRNGHTVASRT